MSRVAQCPHCVGAEEEPIVCDRCAWRWFANPKPAAGTIVERRSVAPDGEEGEPSFLLLRRAVEPGLGAWDLPAGFLEPHESPEGAALRETREETGLDVELVELVGVYGSSRSNSVGVVYLARQADPDAEVRLDHESDDFAWVERRHAASWIERMAFASMRSAVADWAAGRRGRPR